LNRKPREQRGTELAGKFGADKWGRAEDRSKIGFYRRQRSKQRGKKGEGEFQARKIREEPVRGVRSAKLSFTGGD